MYYRHALTAPVDTVAPLNSAEHSRRTACLWFAPRHSLDYTAARLVPRPRIQAATCYTIRYLALLLQLTRLAPHPGSAVANVSTCAHLTDC